MSSKRKASGNANLNFRPPTTEMRGENRGTKPCQEQATIRSVFAGVAMHVCRAIVFVNTNYRVGAYLMALFVISVLADVVPFPRTPFARKDNFFNVYFVKISWGWTLLTSIPFVVCTSLTYCCGDRVKVYKHVMRLFIATCFWWFWTNMFVCLEQVLGRCSSKDSKLNTKAACLQKGFHWQSVDISGHSFILIYSALVLIEECRPIINWDSISDLIRQEEYSRNTSQTENSNKYPLRSLSQTEFDNLKDWYTKLTSYIRFNFLVITVLIIIWDCMLLTTILYFHHMLEKLLAGAVAIVTWYVTYRMAYPTVPFLLMPGDGSFKYREVRQNGGARVRPSLTKPTPQFMGIPLNVKDNLPTPDK